MSDFKEKLKFIMDSSMMLTMLVGAVLSFPIMGISVKSRAMNISAYSYIYIPLLLFQAYYNRYAYMRNFSVTRDEYLKIGQVLNAIISLSIWCIFLTMVFIMNEKVDTSTMFSTFVKIAFFTTLSNTLSLLVLNSPFIAFIGFGGIFAIRYVSENFYFTIPNTMINIIFIILTILCSVISRYIFRSIDFKLK